MGQRCCRPVMRSDPKHTHLLTLIYAEAQQDVKQFDYEGIRQSLNKKGYIKILGDYLSSHLSQIYESVLFCKNKQVSVRGRTITTQLFIGFVTTQILQRIVSTCKEVKRIYLNKMGAKEKTAQQKQQQSERYKDQFRSRQQSKLPAPSRDSKRKKTEKSVISSYASDFSEEEITSIMLETCNQVMKQTIGFRSSLNVQKLSLKTDNQNFRKIEEIQFVILMSLQNIIANTLEGQQNLVKLNYVTIKELLDSLIDILGMCQKPVQRDSRNKLTENIPGSPVAIRSPMKVDKQVKEFELIKNNKNIQASTLKSFTQSEELVQKMRRISLENYSRLIKKGNAHLVNTNLYKDIVRVHMPRLLEHWADLMIQNDLLEQKMTDKDLQPSSDFAEEQETRGIRNKNIRTLDRTIQSIILQFFNSYFSFRESEYIYKELMLIFDRLNFNRQKISPIEKLVFHSLRNYELKQSVISKWFDYLLNYLGILTGSPGGNAIINDSLTLEKKNEGHFSMMDTNSYLSEMGLQLNLTSEKYEYVNWYKEENILGCLRTVYKWIDTKKVNIEDIINFKRTKLMTVILANLAWGFSKVNEQIYRLIQHLIDSDICCLGYLVKTTIYIINRLKLTSNLVVGEESWSYYIGRWQKTKMMSVSESLEIQGIRDNFLRSKASSAVYKLKNAKSLARQLQLVSLSQFLDQLLCMASHPFLGQLLVKQIMDEVEIFEQVPLKKWSSSKWEVQNEQKNNQSMIQKNQGIMMPNSMKKIESKKSLTQSNKEFIKDKRIENQQIRHNRYNFRGVNHNMCSTVFEETVEILFKDINFQNSKPAHFYQVKLSGLFLVANFLTMALITEKHFNRKDINFPYIITEKINKFLSKIYKETKILSTCTDSSIRMSYWQENQSLDQSRYQFSKDIPLHRDSLQKNPHNRNQLGTIRTILNIVHQWIYPSFSFILMGQKFPANQFALNKSEDIYRTQSVSEEGCRRLLGVCIKLYFRNMVNAVKDNAEIRKKGRSSLDEISNQKQPSRSSVNPFNEDRNINLRPYVFRARNFRDSKQLFQQQQKDSVALYFFPIIEVFQLFLELHRKYQINVRSGPENTQRMRQQKEALTQTELKLSKKSITSLSQNKKAQIKNKNLQMVKKVNLEELGERIKANLHKIKASPFFSRRSRSEQDLKGKNAQNDFLKNIVEVEEINMNNQSTGFSQNDHNVLANESQSIIFDPKLCHLLFFLVDQIQNKDLYGHISNRNGDSDRNVQAYLTKNQNQKIVFEQVETASRCEVFKKVKNKMYRVINGQPQILQNQEAPVTSTSVLKQTNNTEGFQMRELDEQNSSQLLIQVIDELEQRYQDRNLVAGKWKEKTAPKSRPYFNLADNDHKKENSVIDSEHLNEGTVEGSSFNSVLSDIQKH